MRGCPFFHELLERSAEKSAALMRQETDEGGAPCVWQQQNNQIARELVFRVERKLFSFDRFADSAAQKLFGIFLPFA